jgi:hypothetical protein
MVFAGLYPVEANQYEELRDALEKLRLNDASFFYEPETSLALGFGFRCGFLGLLHMEIVQERLEREFNVDLITTAPSVRYRVTDVRGDLHEVDNPSKMPPTGEILKIEEPIIQAMIMTNEEYIGNILALLEEKRGIQKAFDYITTTRVLLTYELPLNEIVLDFYDRLKSISRGYASLDYHLAGYREADLVRLDMLVAGEPVDALSLIVHEEFAYARGRALVEKMRKLIPRQLFEVPIQAAIGSRVIARETIKALGKKRSCQVLRGRHHSKAEAAREAEGRQETHEACRQGRHTTGGLPRGAQSKRLVGCLNDIVTSTGARRRGRARHKCSECATRNAVGQCPARPARLRGTATKSPEHTVNPGGSRAAPTVIANGGSMADGRPHHSSIPAAPGAISRSTHSSSHL